MSGQIDWILPVVREGIDPTHECMTSLYVYEVLRNTFGWELGEIVPQKPIGRGPVDYAIRSKLIKDTEFCVEVKAFNRDLRDKELRELKKYISKRGRYASGVKWRVGILTNFRDWRIFLTYPGIHRLKVEYNVVECADITLSSRRDINKLRKYLRRQRSGTTFPLLRRAAAEDPYLIKALCLNEGGQVQKAIRSYIASRLAKPVPQYGALTRILKDYLDNRKIRDERLSAGLVSCALRAKSTLEALCATAEGVLQCASTSSYVKKGRRDLLASRGEW